MEVLIVAKTHMSTMACVGALVLEDNRFIRLLNPGNYNQPGDTDLKVGDVYKIECVNRAHIIPPHVEDVIVMSREFVRRIDSISTLLTERNIVNWSGHIDELFGGNLKWTGSGTGYIPESGPLPIQSVGFWRTPVNLIRVEFNNGAKVRYRFHNGSNYRNISYVGYQETLPTIPAGTIIRVSLSRLFPKEGANIDSPRGFYLQMSGWYIDSPNPPKERVPFHIDSDDDLLPF
jgi:ATP-dependent DNA helicase RecQ